ncbi:hypothetical protein IJG20_00700 [Candidatus Saccharibacteria bacterium]|nr:hypothetical protein [Candidatus Saccharibacteria bacterium]
MYEINLVPDIKAAAIKAQKMRNLVFFLSGAVAAISVAIVVVLGAVRAGQELRINAQDTTLKLMSDKLGEYSGLDELLTIKKQLSDLRIIENNKTVFSRVFPILATMLPSGADSVTISSMSVNMEDSTISIEGQANAGAGTDGIDYRVLESFTKQVGLMKYDYGRYVTAGGLEIPTMCISEADDTGMPYVDEDGNLYAMWSKGLKGCDPDKGDEEVVESETVSESEESGEDEENTETEQSENAEEKKVETVKIYRTPKFNEWAGNSSKGTPQYMSIDGTIEGVPHFESQCIVYTGIDNGGKIEWVSENSCNLAPEGMTVVESRNGRQSTGELVLTFSGTMTLEPEVFDYNNKHLIAIAPTGRVNVTDSLLQVETMFSEKAIVCTEGDAACEGKN